MGLDMYLTVNKGETQVAYWRKANEIHRWFVDQVQNGVDECQMTPVSREQLQSLVRLCKAVQADHSKAPTLLPTRSGFFFGSTDYDKYYFEDLVTTIVQLEAALANQAFNGCQFYYQSSW